MPLNLLGVSGWRGGGEDSGCWGVEGGMARQGAGSGGLTTVRSHQAPPQCQSTVEAITFSGCRGLVSPGICLKWSCLSELGRGAPCPGWVSREDGGGVGEKGGPWGGVSPCLFSYSLGLGGCRRSPAEFQDIKATSGVPSAAGTY